MSAARAVPSAWWTPAWNLIFSTTRQTCPGWRCGCACGSPRCPRGRNSLAPSRPRPSTSCPCLAGVAEWGGGPVGSAGCSGRSALYCAAFAWSAPAGAPRSVPPPAGCACDRDWFNWDWGCERHLRPSPLPYTPKLLSIRNHPPSPRLPVVGERGITQPTPGVVDVQLWEFLAVTTPLPVSRPLGLGSRSLGRLLVGGWVETPVKLNKEGKLGTLSAFLSLSSFSSLRNNCLQDSP